MLTYILRSELDAIVVKPHYTVPTKHVAFPLRRRHLLGVEGHHHPAQGACEEVPHGHKGKIELFTISSFLQ